MYAMRPMVLEIVDEFVPGFAQAREFVRIARDTGVAPVVTAVLMRAATATAAVASSLGIAVRAGMQRLIPIAAGVTRIISSGTSFMLFGVSDGSGRPLGMPNTSPPEA